MARGPSAWLPFPRKFHLQRVATAGLPGSTNSLSVAVLQDLTGLNILPAQAFLITFGARKSAGHASRVAVGLRVNGVDMATPHASVDQGVWYATATNQAETGAGFYWFGVREGTYLASAIGAYGNKLVGAAGVLTAAIRMPLVAATGVMPAGPINRLTLTGIVGNALNTLEVSGFTIYTLPVEVS